MSESGERFTSAILVATLGAEPQVVSIATQLLLRQGEPLSAVILLCTQSEQPALLAARGRLRATFQARPAWPPLQEMDLPLADVLTPEQIDAFVATLFQVLKTQLRPERRLHLLLAGGRKPMAMLGMSIAQILLGPQDAIWYLHSEEAVRRAGCMTLDDHQVARLVQIPVPQLGVAPPLFTPAFTAATPADALARLADSRQRQIRHFVEKELTPAERELAQLVVAEVLTVAQMAARLHKSPKTIANQLNSIYSKLEAAFALQPDRHVKREFLRREIAPYFLPAGPII